MPLQIRPATLEVWPALEDLFLESGASAHCWCMYWRIGAAYRRRPAEENRAALRELVAQGPPPGLLAFEDAVPIGWAHLTPRLALPHLDRTWRLRRVDDLPVWSLSCFVVRKGYRRRGVTAALIDAALEAARQTGAPALEAYPLDASLSPSSTWTGYLTTFERAGFVEVARHVPSRPIVRYDFSR